MCDVCVYDPNHQEDQTMQPEMLSVCPPLKYFCRCHLPPPDFNHSAKTLPISHDHHAAFALSAPFNFQMFQGVCSYQSTQWKWPLCVKGCVFHALCQLDLSPNAFLLLRRKGRECTMLVQVTLIQKV